MAEFGMPRQYGWICPTCGRVYSPWTHKCDECGGPTITTTNIDWVKSPSTTIPIQGWEVMTQTQTKDDANE